MKRSLANRETRKTIAIEAFKEMILQPIPESKMSPEARVASQAHRRATRKKRIELRRHGLPMIIWKDGKVREVPA